MKLTTVWHNLSLIVIVTVGAFFLLGIPGSAQAAWPEKDVTLFVHSGAGSSTDVMARNFAKALEKVTGKNVVITVKGRDAMPALLKAEADGYTLSTQTRSLLAGLASGRYSYSMDEDLQWIARLLGETYILAVQGDSPYKTAQDLFSAARKTPGDIPMATYRTGSTHQMSVLLLNQMANAEFNIIPYDSGQETVVAMLGGNVDVVGTNPSNVLQHIDAGKARGLIVTSEKRLRLLPDVPTAKEIGLDVTQFHWRGIIAKAGIPAGVLTEMDAAFEKAVQTDLWQEYLTKTQLEDLYLDHAASQEFAKKDLADVERLSRELKDKK